MGIKFSLRVFDLCGVRRSALICLPGKTSPRTLQLLLVCPMAALGTFPQRRCGGSFASAMHFRPSALRGISWLSLSELNSLFPLPHRKEVGAPGVVVMGSDVPRGSSLDSWGSVSGSDPSIAFLHARSPLLLGTGLAVREVTSLPRSTPLVDFCPQTLYLAGITKNLVPTSGRSLVLQSSLICL